MKLHFTINLHSKDFNKALFSLYKHEVKLFNPKDNYVIL